MTRRRDIVGFLAASLASGCGFRPVYGPASDGGDGAAATGLSLVTVGPIPERNGQLLRLALQERCERAGVGVAHKYDLVVSFSISTEGISIQTDNSSSRSRVVGTATWRLVGQDPQRTTLTSGTVRSVDGYNVLDQQYFAADLEGDRVNKRVAESVADQIALQLAVWFNKRAKAA